MRWRIWRCDHCLHSIGTPADTTITTIQRYKCGEIKGTITSPMWIYTRCCRCKGYASANKTVIEGIAPCIVCKELVHQTGLDKHMTDKHPFEDSVMKNGKT